MHAHDHSTQPQTSEEPIALDDNLDTDGVHSNRDTSPKN